MNIIGTIEKGAGQGAFFTSLDWVVEQFEAVMGFKPFPGTLNVRVLDKDLSKLDRFFSEEDFEIVPDKPQFCSAQLKKIRVNGILAAAIFPSDDVRIHGKEIIEIMSNCHLKETLHLKDGDEVTITDFNA